MLLLQVSFNLNYFNLNYLSTYHYSNQCALTEQIVLVSLVSLFWVTSMMEETPYKDIPIYPYTHGSMGKVPPPPPHTHTPTGLDDNDCNNLLLKTENQTISSTSWMTYSIISTLKAKVSLFCPFSRILSQIYYHSFNSKGDQRDSCYYQTICQNLKRKFVNISSQMQLSIEARDRFISEI